MKFLSLQIALTHLSYRKRQTLVSISGVAMGVGFFIAMAALMQGFQSYFISTVVDVSPHITIMDEYRNPRQQPALFHYGETSALSIQGIRPREENRGIRGYQAIVESLRQMPDMAVSVALDGQAFLRFGGSEYSVNLTGIVPEDERHITRLEKDMVAGSLNDLETAANGIIIGTGLAKRLGAGMGDSLTAVSSRGVIMRVKVVGLLQTGITAIDNRKGFMLLKKVQIMEDKPNRVSQITMRLTNPDDAVLLAPRLESRFRYRTESWREANAGIFGVFVIQNVVMYSTVTAIMIVAAFGIYNIISTIIHEKARDIAILKSLGFRERDIRRIFQWQGLLVGLCGALLGWGVGYTLTTILASIRVNIEGEIKTDRLFLLWAWRHYLMAAAFALTAALLAASIPARKAARVNPVDIIRGVS